MDRFPAEQTQHSHTTDEEMVMYLNGLLSQIPQLRTCRVIRASNQVTYFEDIQGANTQQQGNFKYGVYFEFATAAQARQFSMASNDRSGPAVLQLGNKTIADYLISKTAPARYYISTQANLDRLIMAMRRAAVETLPAYDARRAPSAEFDRKSHSPAP